MHLKAYERQCTGAETAAPAASKRLALLALALGTFAIGTGEFASNGIIQLFSSDLGVSVPTATTAITAYALGVVIGSPAIVILGARVNRRTLLLALMVLFGVGNVLSAVAVDIASLSAFRFITGSVQ